MREQERPQKKRKLIISKNKDSGVIEN